MIKRWGVWVGEYFKCQNKCINGNEAKLMVDKTSVLIQCSCIITNEGIIN